MALTARGRLPAAMGRDLRRRSLSGARP
jgi:hypothetical protein